MQAAVKIRSLPNDVRISSRIFSDKVGRYVRTVDALAKRFKTPGAIGLANKV